jgi:hypothetical protein
MAAYQRSINQRILENGLWAKVREAFHVGCAPAKRLPIGLPLLPRTETRYSVRELSEVEICIHADWISYIGEYVVYADNLTRSQDMFRDQCDWMIAIGPIIGDIGRN